MRLLLGRVKLSGQCSCKRIFSVHRSMHAFGVLPWPLFSAAQSAAFTGTTAAAGGSV